MRHRCYVLDQVNFQTNRLQGADGGFTAGARPLYSHFHLSHSMRHRLASGILGYLLGGEGGTLARALETDFASRGPAKQVAVHIGDSYLRVVKGGEDVRNASRDVLRVLGLNNLFRVRIFRQELSGGGSGNRTRLDRFGSFSPLGFGRCSLG